MKDRWKQSLGSFHCYIFCYCPRNEISRSWDIIFPPGLINKSIFVMGYSPKNMGAYRHNLVVLFCHIPSEKNWGEPICWRPCHCQTSWNICQKMIYIGIPFIHTRYIIFFLYNVKKLINITCKIYLASAFWLYLMKII